MDTVTMAMVEDLKNKMDGIERKLQEIMDKLVCNGEMQLVCNGEMLEELQDSIRELQ